MTTSPIVAALPFRQMLDEAVRQARRHFRRIYLAVAIPMALAAGLVPLAQAAFFRTALSSAGGGRVTNMPQVALGVGLFAAAMITLVVVSALSYGAMFVAATDALSGREVSMARAWRTMLRARIFGTVVLVGAAVGVGSVFCLLPGLYLGLLFAFTVPVMVEEARFGTAAMRRSSELARYNPHRHFDADPRLHVFLTLVVGAMLGYAISFAVQLPVMVLQQFIVMRDVAGGQRPDPAQLMVRMTWLQVPAQMIGMFTQCAVYLYICFGLALLFFDVRRRKEGLDLEEAVAGLVERHRARRAP
jgi:hypothetical protein